MAPQGVAFEWSALRQDVFSKLETKPTVAWDPPAKRCELSRAFGSTPVVSANVFPFVLAQEHDQYQDSV